MSYIYLQEQEGESSAECFSGMPAYVLSRLNLTAEKSCCRGSGTESCRASRYGTMCGLSTAGRGGARSTSSAADSPARTSAAPAGARESAESAAGCGQSLQESSARYDPDTRLWKTRQCSLFGDLDECLETFPRSGMTRNGVLWELTTSEPPTGASACGYWRTPDTGAGGNITKAMLEEFATKGAARRKNGNLVQLRLSDQVRDSRLCPTPSDTKTTQSGELANADGTPWDGVGKPYSAKIGRPVQTALADKVKYATPTCRNSTPSERFRRKNLIPLKDLERNGPDGGTPTPPTKTARLNPNWVEWLMAWPIGWTDLKPLATGRFRSWRLAHSRCCSEG